MAISLTIHVNAPCILLIRRGGGGGANDWWIKKEMLILVRVPLSEKDLHFLKMKTTSGLTCMRALRAYRAIHVVPLADFVS